MIGCGLEKDLYAETILLREGLHNGDAKFFRDKIVTSVDNKLCIYDLDGSYRLYNVQCNWIDVLEEEGALIYGNFNNETGIIFFDTDFYILEHHLLWENERLNIDPAIIKFDDRYYLTLTEITGTVNNADPNLENGIYTIQLYCSEDLYHWEFLYNVASGLNNLEDVKLVSDAENLYVIYEKEDYDKGPSAICMKTLYAEGTVVMKPEEIVLLPNDADHEPANLIKLEDKYVLFYSSDKEQPGESYMGSQLYYSVYSADFEMICRDVRIMTDIDRGQLLFDVAVFDEHLWYITSVDYLTSGSLAVLESAEILLK